MSKRILILNGSPRKNGNTAVLAAAFAEGAREAGHTVTTFALREMDIHPCLGCFGGGKDPQSPCVQKDGMELIYPAYKEADILALASPMYYWSFSGQLKCAFDRLFAVAECNAGYATPRKECVMLMAAEGASRDNFEPVLHYYEALLRHMGWKNLGTALAGGVLAVGDIRGKPVLEEAQNLGRSLR